MHFYAFYEIAVKSLRDSECVLQRSDVSFSYTNSAVSAVQIIMREYKTNMHHTPLVISLQDIPNSSICPVKALCEYLDN